MASPGKTPLYYFKICTACVGLSGIPSASHAQAPPDPLPQELLQGPLHEAFGQPVVFNAQQGIIVPKRPPDPIEEMAPDQKPEGDNVIWISGYWNWDDQRQDFIWISGLWRAVPPGKTWVPGYWAPNADRFQWVSGFWASADAGSAEYLPPPPASLETGPSSQPPSTNVIWAPGSWIYRDNRYAWRPGFWMNAQTDWVWAPAHYEWTPRGHVFIDGYWDYEIHRRGLLFAPVLLPRALVIRPRFNYTPSVVLDVGMLLNYLFVRPDHCHYYFGDYYAADYLKAGIYPWFSYHNSHIGFDPLFAHLSWVHRTDAHWLSTLKEQYWGRRDVVASRPPHTYAALQTIVGRPNAPKELMMARPLAEVVRLKTSPIALHRVEPARLNEYHQLARDTHTVVTERAKFEAKAPAKGAVKVTEKFELPKASPHAFVPVVEKGKGPPVAPKVPAHHVEPPKETHPALPHPGEIARPVRK